MYLRGFIILGMWLGWGNMGWKRKIGRESSRKTPIWKIKKKTMNLSEINLRMGGAWSWFEKVSDRGFCY
jgi:hypothetical protein